jgi:hypothetical protein
MTIRQKLQVLAHILGDDKVTAEVDDDFTEPPRPYHCLLRFWIDEDMQPLALMGNLGVTWEPPSGCCTTPNYCTVTLKERDLPATAGKLRRVLVAYTMGDLSLERDGENAAEDI